MNISIITVFPEIFQPFLNTSLIKRAIEQDIIDVQLIKFSQLCSVKERIDEPTAGPGSGMIIKPLLIEAGITKAEERWGKGFKLFFTPQGKRLDQPLLRELKNTIHSQPTQGEDAPVGARPHLIIVATRYEGIDARVEATLADETISIGDYVLMGGDLPAQVFLEGFLRLIPGIVGNQESVEHESFSGALLDHPQYGQTAVWHDQAVPDIVKSGNHKAIADWRREEACKKTIHTRFDWFREHQPTTDEQTAAQKNIPPHYAVLMHDEVLMKDGSTGTSSVASLDIHDIARSSTTFGLKGYFLVTRLADQFELIKTFLGFWSSKEGFDYNRSRHKAVSGVQAAWSLDEVIDKIRQAEKIKPIVIATCARNRYPEIPRIDYHSQGKIWAQNRPVLFVFGTAHGLAESAMRRCDYLFLPITGMTAYNHLSVRSAAAIIFDRWLGLNPRL